MEEEEEEEIQEYPTDIMVKVIRDLLGDGNNIILRMDLNGKYIEDQGAIELAEVLKINSTLQTLDLYDNGISSEGTKAIAEALTINTSVHEVNLGRNTLGPLGADSMKNVLQQNHYIKKLGLFFNQLGPEGITHIVEGLKTNQSLKILDCGSNGVGDEGAKILAEFLKKNPSIQELKLYDNQIGDEGAMALADALKTNTSLRKLNLQYNQITEAGARSFIEALKTNTIIGEVELSGNGVGNLNKVVDGLLKYRVAQVNLTEEEIDDVIDFESALKDFSDSVESDVKSTNQIQSQLQMIVDERAEILQQLRDQQEHLQEQTSVDKMLTMLKKKQQQIVLAAQQLRKEKVQLEAEKVILNKEREDWENYKRSMENVLDLQSNHVKLNVGGKVYQTSLDTLQKYKSDLFTPMFCGKFSMKCDDGGAYFIERDGTHFEHLLNFLRTGGNVILPENPFVLAQLFVDNREFYKVEGFDAFLLEIAASYGLREKVEELVTKMLSARSKVFGYYPNDMPVEHPSINRVVDTESALRKFGTPNGSPPNQVGFTPDQYSQLKRKRTS